MTQHVQKFMKLGFENWGGGGRKTETKIEGIDRDRDQGRKAIWK